MITLTSSQLKSREAVWSNWELGQRINEEIRDRKQTLATWFRENPQSRNRDQIYKISEFAKSIDTLEELVELLAVGMNCEPGQPLTWPHFVVLMTVKDKKKRLKLAKIASKESLSAKQLRSRAPLPSTRTPKTGRKPVPPASPEAVLRNVADRLVIELRRLDLMTDSEQKRRFRGVQILLRQMQSKVQSALKADQEQ